MGLLDFLPPDAWVAIGAVGTLATLLVIVFAPLLLGKKALEYEIVSAEPLQRPIKGLQVLYRGSVVPNAHLCSVQITNSGRLPIAAGDFEGPVLIGFRGCSEHPQDRVRVVAFDIDDLNPSTLSPLAAIDSTGRLVLHPLLLNPGDTFTFKFLLDECFDRQHVDFHGRILGVKEIQQTPEPQLGFSLIAATLVFLTGGLILAVSSSNTFALLWIGIAGGLASALSSAKLVQKTRRMLTVH